MTHQPVYSYQHMDPDETCRLLDQQILSESNGQMLPKSHGGYTDSNEVRNQLDPYVPQHFAFGHSHSISSQSIQRRGKN